MNELPRELDQVADRLIALNGDEPGVYFLLLGARVIYVGQSITVIGRVASHRADLRKTFDRAVFLPVPRADLRQVEADWIRALRPALNRTCAPAGLPPEAELYARARAVLDLAEAAQ